MYSLWYATVKAWCSISLAVPVQGKSSDAAVRGVDVFLAAVPSLVQTESLVVTALQGFHLTVAETQHAGALAGEAELE